MEQEQKKKKTVKKTAGTKKKHETGNGTKIKKTTTAKSDKQRRKEKKRIRRERILYWIALIIALLIFLLSIWKIGVYVWQLTESWILKNSMIGQAVVTEDAEADNKGKEEQVTETAPIKVDFEKLWEENEDIVAWLYCPDTVINYPILQAVDNDYYLYRLVNGKKNPSGSLFLDYRNMADFSDLNSVVYGHHMKNNSMFGSLPEYQDQEYYEQHPVMYLLTPKADYKVELLYGVLTDTSSDIYRFPLTQERQVPLFETYSKISSFVSHTEVQPTDRFLTLSTCTYDYDDARYVIIGALRELYKEK